MATQVSGASASYESTSASASYHSSSSSASISSSTLYGQNSSTGYYTASYQATNEDPYEPLTDHVDIVEFSDSLDDTLRYLIDKVILVGQDVAKSSVHLDLMR